jgi:predicted nucleotidyltransferase component of viral defense system
VIPAAFLQEWSAKVPWPDQRQVEQDLVICRALCDLFNADPLADMIAFRGGTAIHKLLFARPLRYSEDIDLVQTKAGPIGKTVDAIRGALAWLGPCKRTQAAHSMHLYFSFTPEADAVARLRLKVEINTREHVPCYPIRGYPFSLENPWYTASSTIRSYEPEELFGTKLRALLQRRKSRDLFDLHEGLTQLQLDPSKIVSAFEHYLAAQGAKITRAQAEEYMLSKLTKSLTEDITPLLPAGVVYGADDALAAFANVWFALIARIEGEPWRRSDAVIEKLRERLGNAFLRG